MVSLLCLDAEKAASTPNVADTYKREDNISADKKNTEIYNIQGLWLLATFDNELIQ